jgi:hypothetical protein
MVVSVISGIAARFHRRPDLLSIISFSFRERLKRKCVTGEWAEGMVETVLALIKAVVAGKICAWLFNRSASSIAPFRLCHIKFGWRAANAMQCRIPISFSSRREARL